MVFSSTVFLFLFLPLMILIYYSPICKSQRFKNYTLLLGSLAFYAWGEPIFVFLMILSILLTWFIGLHVKNNRAWLVLGISYHILLLFIFKYIGFVGRALNDFLGANYEVPDIPLPIGISFFTFQLMSYLFDIHYKKAEPQSNPLMVGLYIALFPQLIAGPIVRYDYIARQLTHRKEILKKFSAGMERFAIGLGKKVLIADYLALTADLCFDNISGLSVATAWLGAIAYTLQIYFDFSGYSDMAIGLGKMFGFDFAENFNYPYMAKSITDFWRRWHISLSSWFRDYVYIPLGGNRVTRSRWVLNISLVWLLTGIWHGANWTFILWGLIYLVCLLSEKMLGLDKRANIFTRIYSLVIVAMAWVVFRADNVHDAMYYLGTMMFLNDTSILDDTFWGLLSSVKIILVIGLLGSTPLLMRIYKKLYSKRIMCPIDLFVFLVFVLSIVKVISSTYSPFIYFNF